MIQADSSSFWSVNFGQLLVAVGVSAAWIISRAMDWRSVNSKIDEHSLWIERHEADARERDSMLSQLVQNTTRLTTLQESTEYRLRNLESDSRKLSR